jgi:hypothetical protein
MSMAINRREFIVQTALAGSGLLTMVSGSTLMADANRVRWTRRDGLFTGVICDGQPMTPTSELLEADVRLAVESSAPARLSASRDVSHVGPLRAELRHHLANSGNGMGDDVLEASLTVGNTSDRPQRIEVEFITSAQPSSRVETQHVYIPLSAAGLANDPRFTPFGVKGFLKDGDLAVGRADIQCHYLEPMASYAGERETKALLLAPVVDIRHPQALWRVAMFTPSDQPMRFRGGGGTWRAGREITVPAGGQIIQRCWLMLHTGDASVAWRTYHHLAHQDEFAVPDWAREFKVHYYDFLSSAQGEKGRRGDGYESDLPHFREFRVGLATQHGYYPAIGDYIHPDRKTWQAMRGDKQGAAEMSLEKMRARIKATRQAGARAAIYLHAAALDDASPCFAKLGDAVQVDAQGRRMSYDWAGPDTAGRDWRSSLASPQWREHLLQQAGWIMDILQPDAIVVDETFVGLGYDYHPTRPGATSAGAIEFYRKLRSLVRSFGQDKAFFTSDCSMSPFVLWADGECGDHAYSSLLGHPLYMQEPVRYLAALGDKPWRPCAWQFQAEWEVQMKLAHLVGAGVGVSNGWLEYAGLARLPVDAKTRLRAGINTLFEKK